jgi:hypothetical protein
MSNKPKFCPSRSSEEAYRLMCDPEKLAIAGVITQGHIRGFPPLDKPRVTEPAYSDTTIRVTKDK